MDLDFTGENASRLGGLLIQHTLEAIFFTAPDGRIFFANPAACELFGYSEAEFIEGGRSLISDANDTEVATIMAARKQHGYARGEQWMRRKNGSLVRVEVTSVAFQTRDGQRSVVVVRDLSQQANYQYLQRILDAAATDLSLSFCVGDEEWRLLWVNQAMEQITGYTRQELLGNPAPLHCYLEAHDPEKLALIKKSLKAHGTWSGGVFSCRRNGEIYPGQLTISTIDSPHPGQRHLVATLTDISAMRDYEHRLHKASLYDPITGLPNRVLFKRQAYDLLHDKTADSKAYYLCIIDIDGFRRVNEAHGHKIGDRVLAEFARRLRDCLPEQGILARHMGDSFAVLLADMRECKEITETALQVKKALCEPLQVEGVHFALTPSIGISNYPRDGLTPGALLQAAESALQGAKRRGGDSHAFYAPGSEGDSRRVIELAASMREGLAKGEFLAYFQPIVDSRTQRMDSMEALARWRRADGTIVSPDKFIPIAERSNMIDEITETLLRQACRHMRRLDANGYPNLSTSVNLSARQFYDPELPQRLLQIIADERVSPNRIALEITESILMDDPQGKSALIETLRAQGMPVMIDDFGTGYSSFAYLKHFEIDGIKLDRVFVKDVPGQRKDEALIRMMIAVGNELSVPVVAEGVETQGQARFLSGHGCSLIQGYLVAAPMPTDEFAVFLNTYNSSSA